MISSILLFNNFSWFRCLVDPWKFNVQRSPISYNIMNWLFHWAWIYVLLKFWLSQNPQKLMPTNINETTVHDISFEAVRHSLCFSWFSIMWVFVEINYRLSTQHHSKTWSSHPESQSLESWQSASVTDIVYTLTTEGHSL